MDSNVLVLNQDYQPHSVCSVERSLKLIFLEKAEMLHEYADKCIRTVDREFAYPSVIRLRRYINLPFKRIVLSRRNVMKRDNYSCQYCGVTSSLTIDHVMPRSRGGGDSWENLVTACTSCNTKKGNRTPDEAKMPLSRKPYRPHYIAFMRVSNGSVNEKWKPYLYMS